jgi:hypothetical protein
VLPFVTAWRRGGAGRWLAALAIAVFPLWASCGKKGPPLAPLIRLPVAPSEVAASRAGDVVTVTFTVPNVNVSGVRPADIERVDLYAWTGPNVPPARIFKVATVVASVPVHDPPPPEDERESGAPPPPPPVGPGVDQGAAAHLVETLTADALQAVEVPPEKRRGHVREVKLTPPAVTSLSAPLSRHYVAVGVNHGGRRGRAPAAVSVPLWPAPAAPTGLTATVHETGTTVTWHPPATLRRPIQEPRPQVEGTAQARNDGASSPPVLPSRVIGWPSVSTGYHVYEIPRPGQQAGATATPSPAAAGGTPAALPTRLTGKPLSATTFTVEHVTFGVERCYAVCTIETIGTMSVESSASEPVCVKAADVFPPAAPKSLAAVASEGAISLIWEANSEPDLAGYLVMRGIAPGAPTDRLTPQPIRETTYRDTTVKPGTRYVYEIVAVDTATPPNASAPSNRVQETAR